MLVWLVFSLIHLQWTFTGVSAFGVPRLPGLYTPELCLPMSDHSYPGDPDGDVSQEVLIANWNQETLFCQRGCCGDSKEAKCCLPEPEEGLGAFELISIVAAGIAGVTVVTVTALYFIKQHNKNKVLVHDINNINKMNGKVKAKGEKADGKVGQYHKTPDFSASQKQGQQQQQQLFRKTNSPQDMMKRPKTPISMVSPPEVLLPTIFAGPSAKPNSLDHLPQTLNQTPLKPVKAPVQHQLPAKTASPPAFPITPLEHLPGINQTPQKPVEASPRHRGALIADLKAPSPSDLYPPAPPAPSPPMPDNLPPPLISAPTFKTAHVDDDFIDSILASIPMEDTAKPSNR